MIRTPVPVPPKSGAETKTPVPASPKGGPQAAPVAAPEASSNIRTAPRRRVYLQSGKVFDITGKLIAEVRLRDVSASGMQIVLDHPLELPPQFRVEVLQSRALVTGTALWRRGHIYGARVVADNGGLWSKATRDGSDRRQAPRRRVHMQTAKFFTEDGNLLGEGMLRDISTTGMQIALANFRELPMRFHVHIEHNRSVSTCKVVWRRDRLVGLRII